MCTPALRPKITATGVHVAYVVLKEGARAVGDGVPVDEGYRKLLDLLAEAAGMGSNRVMLAQYQRVLGTAPSIRDLMETDVSGTCECGTGCPSCVRSPRCGNGKRPAGQGRARWPCSTSSCAN